MARHSLAIATLALTALAACGDDPGVIAPSAKAPSAPSLAVAGTGAAATTVAGQYIVAFKPGVGNGRVKAQEMVSRGNGHLKHTYAYALNGFAAELSDAAVAVLRRDPDIASIEPDPVVSLTATQTGAIWGLDRLDQAALPLSTTYTYANDGSGVSVYILDTGINTAHTQFGGRAVPGYDAITAGGTAADCHGHGTHVAGTVGGVTYGVAKGVRLVAVRVLDCTGNGTGSSLLAGLDYIAQQKAASPSTPMVMNMSLGGSASQMLDDGVQNVINKGVVAAVAAGNSATDACTTSPARLPSAITVGATDQYDNFASFSNYGACVDLEAPGVTILSSYYTSTTATAYMSGTSMATPHVAGAAALYLKANPTATPAQVATALTANAVVGAVKSVPGTTVNKLLNVSFLGTPAPAPTVAVSPTSATLTIGGATALTATVTNPVTGGTVTWTSRNPAVATVASTGASTATATAVAPGSAYVVSTYTAGTTTVRDSALVTVAAPTVAVSPTTSSLLIGGSAGLTATIGNAAAGGTLSWVARNAAVATVATTGAATATATAAGAGSTYIVASYVAGGTTVRDSALISVATPTVAVSPTSASILVGGTTALAATVSNGGTGGSTSWVSRNTAVATVGSTGIVTGVADGSVYVVATYTAGNTSVRDSALVSVSTPAPPPPPPTATVGPLNSAAGKGCVMVNTKDANAQTWLSLGPCVAGAAYQTWTVQPVGTAAQVKLASGLCLSGASGVVGASMYTATCATTAMQTWTYTAAGELKLSNGYCLVALTVSWGTKASLAVCDGSAAQRWNRQ